MKKAKCKIYINGVYLETCPSFEAAQMRVETYQRMDRYEVEVEGYTNSLPTYEIKEAI